jgi:uncharacterized membrane protein YeiH
MHSRTTLRAQINRVSSSSSSVARSNNRTKRSSSLSENETVYPYPLKTVRRGQSSSSFNDRSIVRNNKTNSSNDKNRSLISSWVSTTNDSSSSSSSSSSASSSASSLLFSGLNNNCDDDENKKIGRNRFRTKATDARVSAYATEEKSSDLLINSIKHFVILGSAFSLLLLISYVLLPIVGYTAERPTSTEKLMVQKFSTLMTFQANEWLRFVDLFGTGVFAHGGVIAAGKRGLDLLGCIVVGCITAMGGGTIRGALVGIEGAHPVFWIAEPEYLIVALLASVFTFFFWPKVLTKEIRESKAMEQALNWLDAISLGGFCIIGANAALVRNLGPLLAIALSAITCTGGGIVRDVFLRQPVRVLHSHAELYGTTAISGATVYTFFAVYVPSCSHNVRCLFAALTCIVMRWQSWRRGLRLPLYAEVIAGDTKPK